MILAPPREELRRPLDAKRRIKQWREKRKERKEGRFDFIHLTETKKEIIETERRRRER